MLDRDGDDDDDDDDDDDEHLKPVFRCDEHVLPADSDDGDDGDDDGESAPSEIRPLTSAAT